ncbi:MAG: hypothetical protein ACOC7R_03660 [Planctomycetota bacterium]
MRRAKASVFITDANTNEQAVLVEHLEAGRLYVMDRGCAGYQLLAKIIAADSSFVCRLQDSTVFEVIEERELDNAALGAGVVRLSRLPCRYSCANA